MKSSVKHYGIYNKPVIDLNELLETDIFDITEIENQSGLYFMWMPCDNDKYFFAKVGKAKNVASRLKQYQSYNPAYLHTDDGFLPTPEKDLSACEQKCHEFLAKYAVGVLRGCNEWFIFKNTDDMLKLILNTFTTCFENPFYKIAYGL